MLLYILGLTVIVLAGGYLLGIPVLSLLSGLDLEEYKGAFMVLLLAGGLYGMITILNYGITVMRRQKTTLFIYVAVAALVQALTRPMILGYGVMGAVCLYLMAMTAICLAFGAACVYYVFKL